MFAVYRVCLTPSAFGVFHLSSVLLSGFYLCNMSCCGYLMSHCIFYVVNVLESYIVYCAIRKGVVYGCHTTGRSFGEVCSWSVCSVMLCMCMQTCSFLYICIYDILNVFFLCMDLQASHKIILFS